MGRVRNCHLIYHAPTDVKPEVYIATAETYFQEDLLYCKPMRMQYIKN